MIDYRPIEEAVRLAGFDPEDPELSYEGSSICLDGSRTVTCYRGGEHIASAFCPAVTA